MAKTLLGPTDTRLLSEKVTPAELSAPVTRTSAVRTGMPAVAGTRLPSRSICTLPLATLTWPMSFASHGGRERQS